MYKILITGGYGFIGANFIKYLVDNHSEEIEFPIINVDKYTYAANPKYIAEIENIGHKNFIFPGDNKTYIFIPDKVKTYQENIINREMLDNIIKHNNINIVINFAAETHVDNSILSPKDFIDSNYVGVFTLLEICKKYNIRFHQISTDEVYGSAIGKQCFKETDKFNPSSPYSATKAAADLLIKSYIKTYKLPCTISYCTNNYGPNQHKEKLIPKTIDNILNNKKIPIYGNGKQIRNWIYVSDHCSAIWTIIKKGKIGNSYNISGNKDITNLYLVKHLIYKITNNKNLDLVEFITDRPAHDVKYCIDDTKIKKLGWNPKVDFEKGLDKTIEYYKEK